MFVIASATSRKCSRNLVAMSSYTGLCSASSSEIRIIFRQYIAIQLVASAWSGTPPPGSGSLRLNTPMLSSPRNPP